MIGTYVLHVPSNTVRRVTGARAGVLMFSQVVKQNNETYYWASASECLDIGLSRDAAREVAWMHGRRSL